MTKRPLDWQDSITRLTLKDYIDFEKQINSQTRLEKACQKGRALREFEDYVAKLESSLGQSSIPSFS